MFHYVNSILTRFALTLSDMKYLKLNRYHIECNDKFSSKSKANEIITLMALHVLYSPSALQFPFRSRLK